MFSLPSIFGETLSEKCLFKEDGRLVGGVILEKARFPPKIVKNDMQRGATGHILCYRLLDAGNDVADIVIGHIRAGGQAEADFEEVLFHSIGVRYHVRAHGDQQVGVESLFSYFCSKPSSLMSANRDRWFYVLLT